MQTVNDAATEIANAIDAIPTEQMVTDLIEGAAFRLNVSPRVMRMAVTHAYHPIHASKPGYGECSGPVENAPAVNNR